MTFTQPSFSEAKKQQELLAPTITSIIQSATQPVNGIGIANNGSTSSGNNMPPPPSKGNPYAKRKQQIGFTETDSHTSRIIGTDTTTAPKTAQYPAYSLPLPNLGPNATFSQAFSSVEEFTEINHNDSLRVEQKSFDREQSADYNINSSRENHMSLQTHVLHVSNRQRGNGILRYIRNVPVTFSDIIPDFITSPNRCQLFLSFKYHCLHPTYIHKRISELRSDFDLRVLLCLVDVDDNASILFALNKLCVVNNMTLVLAWSEEEAARYLETFKTFENNNGSIIQRREQTTFVEQIADTLTAIKSVNKTDAIQLLGHCGSLLGIVRTPIDQLGLIPGLGPKKVRRVYDAIHKPFSSVTRKEKTENQGEIVLEASESHSDPEKGDSTKEALRNESRYNPDKGDSTIQQVIPDNVDQEVSENSTEAPIASN